ILGIFHLLFAPLLRALAPRSLQSAAQPHLHQRTSQDCHRQDSEIHLARSIDRYRSAVDLFSILSWFPVSKLSERDISPRGTTSDFRTLSFLVCLRAVGTFFV